METPSPPDTAQDSAAAGGAATGCADSPVLVTRGETTHTHIAHVDWLAFTVPPGEGRDWRWLRSALHDIFNIPLEAWKGTSRKWSGYTHRVDLHHSPDRGESLNLGLAAHGGESQRGTMHASLNGQACARIQDWQLIHAWGDSVNATITRVDLAHDDFEASTFSIETVREWYSQGLFSTNGRPPAAELIDDLGSGKGKTFYIGNRSNGKLVRFYEKGKKEGDPDSPWVRAEVEWRKKNRLIPWDTISNPSPYLAGAYPCLEFLSREQEKIKTIQRAGSINYDASVKWARTAVGKTLNVILQVEGGDKSAALDLVLRDGVPKRLEPYIGIPDALSQKRPEDGFCCDDENPES